MSDTGGHQRLEVRYHGMVQGVGFRYTTRKIAARYRVTGFVQNQPDGRVLVVAEGPPEELDRFLGDVRSQMSGCIDDVRETAAPATGEFRHFDIRY